MIAKLKNTLLQNNSALQGKKDVFQKVLKKWHKEIIYAFLSYISTLNMLWLDRLLVSWVRNLGDKQYPVLQKTSLLEGQSFQNGPFEGFG